jgi:hypothetical protein
LRTGGKQLKHALKPPRKVSITAAGFAQLQASRCVAPYEKIEIPLARLAGHWHPLLAEFTGIGRYQPPALFQRNQREIVNGESKEGQEA